MITRDPVYLPFLSKRTDDGLFRVTIEINAEVPPEAVVSTDALLRLAALLTGAADKILRADPTRPGPCD